MRAHVKQFVGTNNLLIETSSILSEKNEETCNKNLLKIWSNEIKNKVHRQSYKE